MKKGSGRRCVIVGGAPIQNYTEIRRYLHSEDYYIFCDCGLNHRKMLGVEADLIVGDFDSWENADWTERKPALLNQELNYREVKQEDRPENALSSGVTEDMHIEKTAETDPASNGRQHPEVLQLPHDKYDTDTVYGVREGIARGFDEFLLIGVIGKRFDHTLANLYILLMLDQAGKHGVILDDYSEMELVGQKPALIDECFSGFSLLNITGTAKKVRIENARYEYLPNEEIPISYQYAVSNEVLPGQTARVRVGEGHVLLIRNRGENV